MAEEIIGIGLFELLETLGIASTSGIADEIVSSLGVIINTLDQDGFAAVQALMKGYSENELYTIINSIAQDEAGGAIYLTRSIKVIGMTPSELINNINIIAKKLLAKGIDIMTASGKQIFLDIMDQLRKLSNSGLLTGVTTGAGIQSVIDKYVYKNQNENKIDYNQASKIGSLGGSSTNNI
jgi:hypothetical protein